MASAWFLQISETPTSLPDVCLFARAPITQTGKPKIRATWGYPFKAFIEEARFSYPYMDWLRTADAPIAYNLEMSRGGMAAIDRVATSTGYKYIMLDWKRFDKHEPAWLLRDVFDILSEAFDFSHVQCSEKKIWKVRSNRSTNCWNFMVDYFINTPIRTSKRERWIKDHGVPPGSGFTNLIDTIVNAIMV